MISRYHIIRLLAPVMGRLPRLFYPVADLVAWTGWRLRPDYRRNLVRNMLPLCDGDRSRARREAARAYGNLARYWVDIATIPHRNMATFERDCIRIMNPERLAPIEQRGPVLIVSAHLGNPEFALQAIAVRGRRFTALVENIQPPEMAAYMHRLRTAAGGQFQVATFSGVRACLEALRAGEVVGIVADRDIQGTGICATVAGRRVKLPRGPWELARRAEATIVPVFSSRDSRDRFTLRVEEPFRVAQGKDADADIAGAIERWACLLERALRREPGQWCVLEDFWKNHACG